MSDENNIELGFSMEFDSNTIDHLGIKLYSQFPPVLAELVSNAYDAEATKVEILIDRKLKKIIIKDDGVGMTHDEINGAYLKIGRNRRIATGTGLSKNEKRKVTGKKGLGKLAIFGIAKTIIVTSISEGFKNSLKINYYPSLEKDGTLRILSYSDLLIQAKKYNEEFIKAYEKLGEKRTK